ncbi:NAD(P)H-dependent oxidoreductase [Oenococcus sp.]|uniref:NAD(P)H-dependent oxidoreductase n=1 Tax=Oenococcus sp. TaxID=1979414 RepID=UPI0039E80BA4
MNFVALVGTNASYSFNRQLLAYMQRQFAKEAQITIVEISNLPLFSEDKVLPDIVKQLQNKIDQADGVIIATPEYDHSIPAALKSAIEWLSWEIHPLRERPVMIVGTSLGIQGTSRAQQHLRQILDSPGVGAFVMPGDEMLLGFAQNAFDARGDLKTSDNISFLRQCFTDFLNFVSKIPKKEPSKMEDTKKNAIQWESAVYDVIVLGFGAAGATAARFAADAGAKVLIVDSAPDGHEGGNTRYAGQVVLAAYDFKKMKAYFKRLFGPIAIEEDTLDTYVNGLVNMRDYFKKYLGVKNPISYNKVHRDPDYQAFANGLSPEYPEYAGADTVDLTTVHDGYFDASLWKNLRKQVTDRTKEIDVWLESPALHLISDPDNQTVEGVQMQRKGQTVNVRARNGVVMAMGGFENNRDDIQNFIGVPKLKVSGTLYNKGDGIRMAQEVGAKLWHMKSFEGYGFDTGLVFDNPDEERGKFILSPWPELSHGSIFVAADDGGRYLREDEDGRHGHAYEHGSWKSPTVYEHPHLIFDQAQFDKIQAQKELPYPNLFKLLIKADSLDELADKIHADHTILANTVAAFNQFAENGEDAAFHRDPASMQAFSQTGPYYAAPLATAMLNTQGGAKRNSRAEVLNGSDQPIPHLYSAGEFGGINANQYNGGGNLAECLIFGKIAGENAAAVKGDQVIESRAAANTANLGSNDLSDEETLDQYETAANQYLGVSEDGIGGQVVVRVTYMDNKIAKVEVLKESESEDVGHQAVLQLPDKMVEQNTYDVDAVSGASASSRAIKSAVENALDKIQHANTV